MSKVSEAVAALDAVSGDDPEHAHAEADDIIEAMLPDEVREAYRRVGARCRWWAFA